MRTLVLALLIGAAACYQPRITSGQYRCDQPDDVCPSGFVCAEGRCVDPRDVPPDLRTSADDLSTMPEPPDLAAPADLQDAGAPPDLGGDLASPTGCTMIGAAEGRDILACKVAFSAPNGPTSCPTEYRVCNADDDKQLNLAASAATCQSAGGFYAAQISASIKANGDVQCEAQTVMSGWALVGCGSEMTADGTAVATRTVGNNCKHLQVVLPCSVAAKDWTCTAGLGDTTKVNAARGGLLCCRKPI